MLNCNGGEEERNVEKKENMKRQKKKESKRKGTVEKDRDSRK